MAQKQLNDPPPVLEGSSFSDQTSQLDETRPPDPPDHSLSLRSDEQPSVSISTPDSMGLVYLLREPQVVSVIK